MGWLKAVIASALALIAVMAAFAAPAKAVDRSGGDYWVYEGGMNFEDVPVTGEFRYEFQEKDSLTLGTESHEVNVLKVTGSMSGETDDLMGTSASVSVVFSGFTYEIDGSLASIKEDMHVWSNFTFGTGSFALIMRMEMQSVTVYTPPLLSGFVEGETGTGDQWEEVVNITDTTTVWMDNETDGPSTDDYNETYTCSIAASEDTVTTDAGTFDCLKMTITDSEGNYDIYWYSADVGSWVQLASYSEGETSAYMSLELTEYKYSKGSDVLMLVLIGAGILIAVVVVVVLVMMMRGKGKAPAVAPQQAPPPSPPTG